MKKSTNTATNSFSALAYRGTSKDSIKGIFTDKRILSHYKVSKARHLKIGSVLINHFVKTTEEH